MIVDTRKAMDGQAVAMMLVLCLVFSLQQVGIKAAAHDAPPILQIALRSGIAAILVGILMLVRKEKIGLATSWRPGLAVGVLFALEFLFLGEGLRHTSAAHSVVFLYTGPIFAALGLHLKLPSERLEPIQWLGIALAFAGIAIAFFLGGETSVDESKTNALLGDFLCIVAGMSWGATTVVIRCTSLSSTPATKTLLYQLIGAFVILLGSAVMLGQMSFNPTKMAIGNLVFQSVIVSFAGYLAWFGLLRRYLASRLGVYSFMTPLFGVVLGAWLLNERIRPSFLAGAGFVLVGVVLVSGHEWLKQAVRRFVMPEGLLTRKIGNNRYHERLNSNKD